MQGDRLPGPPRGGGDLGQGGGPPVVRVQQAGGRDGQPLGGEPEPTDVRDPDEALADGPDVLRLEVVRVAARDDNVLELRGGFDVGEDFVPAPAGRLEGGLGYLVCVGTYGVGTCAKGAVGWADGDGW